MAKATRKYGMVTFYVRPENRKDFDTFVSMITKDARLQPLKDKAKAGLISIAIMQLIIKYIDENTDSVEDDTSVSSGDEDVTV